MGEHDEMTIPGVGDGGEQVSAAGMLGGIAGRNRGDFLGALGRVGDWRAPLCECRTVHDRRHDQPKSGQPSLSRSESTRILPLGRLYKGSKDASAARLRQGGLTTHFFIVS